ncbi:MAG: hypothetical protein DDT37_01914 [Firmicutes bacterium]|nr:hypothetical protein [candidate division NPL-UPA2 bacterium]
MGVGLIETDAFIARQNGLASKELTVAVTHGIGHGGDFVATLFAQAHRSAETSKCFDKKGLDKVRLQFARGHAFHVFANMHHLR